MSQYYLCREAATGTPQIDRDLDDIRSEVDSLAKTAMPGKNTDELMKDYEGREDELIQLLRGMLDTTYESRANSRSL